MAKLARDVMTPDPVCCSPRATLDEVARMMVDNNCGEISIVDDAKLIGVITDRDIVCCSIADGKNPMDCTVDAYMTRPAIAVRGDAPLDEVILTMEEHQIRRVPVVEKGFCAGIISQADLAVFTQPPQIAELLCEVSRDTGRPSL